MNQSSTSDQQQIRQLIRDWLEASKQQQTDRVLSLIAEDAVFLVAGRDPFDKAAFASASEKQKEMQVHFDGHSEILELQVIGQWAFAITKISLTIHRPGAEPMQRSGNTLTLFEKIDGQWKLARDANLM